jgi:histidyl-tRNA synthetase
MALTMNEPVGSQNRVDDALKVNHSLPSGFIEFAPTERALELYCLDAIRSAAERYGFCSVETPLVERLEVLQAKGNQGDNLIYGINPIFSEGHALGRPEDDGKEVRGLRFDLTVPLAAYIARHLHQISFPFARYQMDVVFRGERPKKGRYRSFKQCDFDIVGRGSLPLMYDALMPALIHEIFLSLRIGEFLIRINNRKVLCGFFESLGVASEGIRGSIKIVDNAEKVGEEKTLKSLGELGVSVEAARQICEFVRIKGVPRSVIAQLSQHAGRNLLFDAGLSELTEVAEGLELLGIPQERVAFDMGIARGLGYYTGTVYETTLLGQEGLGSICSGGRYEHLVGIFARESLPGVGISIGWTRLFGSLVERGILKSEEAAHGATAAVLFVDKNLQSEYLKLAQELRTAGISTVSLFEERGLGKQFGWANKAGVRFALVIGSREFETGMVTVKNMRSGDQVAVDRKDVVEYLRGI